MSKNQHRINVSVTFRHTEPTEAIKSYAVEKITHVIEKYIVSDTECHVILIVDKREHIAEVNLRSKRFDISAKSLSHDMYIAIDKVSDTIAAQLRKQKGKLVDHKATVAAVAALAMKS